MSVDNFTAADAVLGYVYQFRYALDLALERMRENPDHSVSIEIIDDVAFESSAGPQSLIQLKHHAEGTGNLTNLSVDLWKTLRVWSTAISAGELNPNDTVLILATTAIAPNDSAASYLRSENRDSESALVKLEAAASTSTNAELGSAFTAFNALPPRQKSELFAAIYVADGQPNAEQMLEALRRRLALVVSKDRVNLLTERLEGWWFGQVIRALSSTPKLAIPLFAIDQKLDALREEFSSENLPIDFRDLYPTEDEQSEFLSQMFVRQMQLVGANHQLVDAIKDYYRAFSQRNRWVSDNLLYIDDLEVYENRLVEEWQSQFHWMLDELGKDIEEEEMRSQGRKILRWVFDVPDLYIKPECTEPYVVRGNFHILADHLRVGWHPKFEELLNQAIAKVAS